MEDLQEPLLDVVRIAKVTVSLTGDEALVLPSWNEKFLTSVNVSTLAL